jgi:hypothetical protein
MDRNGEVLEGLSGSTVHKERGMCGKEPQELGRPWQFLAHWMVFWKLAHEIRIFSHIRGNHGTEVCRTLNMVEDAS